MSSILKSLLKERKSDSIQDEIRNRVLARYSEMQGLETEKTELESTLDALQEMTSVPRHEIDKIAREVQESYPETGSQLPMVSNKSLTNLSNVGLIFEEFNEKAESAQRKFVYHLVPYVVVNSVLVTLNIITSSFPWSMFPVFFWGIGTISHFLASVYWPRKDLKRMIATVQTQVHQILSENCSGYFKGSRPDLFQGVYRLTVMNSSKQNLEEYLLNADAGLTESDVKQISTQVRALQQQYLTKKFPDYSKQDD